MVAALGPLLELAERRAVDWRGRPSAEQWIGGEGRALRLGNMHVDRALQL